MEDIVLADLMSSTGRKKRQPVTLKGDTGKNQKQATASMDDIRAESANGGSGSKSDKGKVVLAEKVGQQNLMMAQTDQLQNLTEEVNNEENGTPLKRKRGADGDIMHSFFSQPKTSRLRPRRVIPLFQKVELKDMDNQKIVGMRIKVYWPESRRWFVGRIKSFDDAKNLHKIHYEDGDKEDLDLANEKFELELMVSDSSTKKPEPTGVETCDDSFEVKRGADTVSDDLLQMVTPKQAKKIMGKQKKIASGKSAKSSTSNSEIKENIQKKTGKLTMQMNVNAAKESYGADSLKDHKESKAISVIPGEASKVGLTQAPKADDCSKESEKAFSVKVLMADDVPLKYYVRVKRDLAQGAASSSKIYSGKESKLAQKASASHEETEHVAENGTERDFTMSNAAGASNSNFGSNINQLGSVNFKIREDMDCDGKKHKRLVIKLPSKNAMRRVEDEKFPDIAKETEKDSDLKISIEEYTDANFPLSNEESLLDTAENMFYQAPAKLQLDLNVESTESAESQLKIGCEEETERSSNDLQEVAGTQTLLGGTQMELTSQEAVDAALGGKDSAISQRNNF